MVVHDAVEAIKTISMLFMILQVHPILDSAQVVSQVDEASWLNAREDDLAGQTRGSFH
jgi:hypothetical protein